MKDPRDSIASKNNNKSVNDSTAVKNVVDPTTAIRHHSNKTKTEMQNTPAGDGSGMSEYDLMWQEKEESENKDASTRSNLFNEIVNWYGGNKEGASKITEMQNALAQRGEGAGLSNTQKSDAKMLGKYGELFNRDGDHATWSGNWYDTGDKKADHWKNVDLAKSIFGRYNKGGSHYSTGEERRNYARDMGVSKYPKSVENLMSKMYNSDFSGMKNDDMLSQAIQEYVQYKN